MSKTEKQKVGDIGEKIACLFLKSKGFVVAGVNYRKPWGEIDIIVHKKGKIHFIEVKTVKIREKSFSVSHETTHNFFEKSKSLVLEKFLPPESFYSIKEIFNGEGHDDNGYRPEDNLHPWKLKRLKRAILSYLEEKHMTEEDDWQFDAVTVRLDEKRKIATVEYLEDIIL